MIKNIEMFMELDNQREEMEVIAKTYAEVGDIAHDKAVMCIEEEDLIAYGVWMDFVELCDWYLDELYTDMEKIKEKLLELVEEA